MQHTPLKVMTVTISKEVSDKFSQQMDGLSLRRDAYLAKQLPNEVARLDNLPAIREEMSIYLRQIGGYKRMERVKLGLKLPQDLVEKINDSCRSKGIPRDFFIETFINFLANGRKGIGNSFTDTPSPLWKAREYLDDPYFDTDGKANIYQERILESTAKIAASEFFQDLYRDN